MFAVREWWAEARFLQINVGSKLENFYQLWVRSRVLRDTFRFSRFIINIPEEGRKDMIRIFFQIENAHWFYLDFYCKGNPELKPLGIKEFSARSKFSWKIGRQNQKVLTPQPPTVECLVLLLNLQPIGRGGGRSPNPKWDTFWPCRHAPTWQHCLRELSRQLGIHAKVISTWATWFATAVGSIHVTFCTHTNVWTMFVLGAGMCASKIVASLFLLVH